MAKKKEYPIHSSMNYWLNRLVELARDDLARQLEPFEMTPPQWTVLNTIFYGKGDTPAEIADYIGVDRSAVTRLVDRLENKGLVARTQNTSDHRSVNVELTDEGVKIMPELIKISRSCDKRLQSILSSQDSKQFRESTRQILASLGVEVNKLWKKF